MLISLITEITETLQEMGLDTTVKQVQQGLIEIYPGGIDDMNLIDIIEMFCDWKAATLRHNDGNILKSIEHNKKRFEMDPQLSKIMQNTVELFEHVDGIV